MKVKLERSWNGVLRRVWPRGCGVGGPVAVENVLVKRSEKFWSTENSIRVLAGVFESSKALKMLPLKFWKGPRRSFESFGALKIISLNLRHSERLWNVENLKVSSLKFWKVLDLWKGSLWSFHVLLKKRESEEVLVEVLKKPMLKFREVPPDFWKCPWRSSHKFPRWSSEKF